MAQLLTWINIYLLKPDRGWHVIPKSCEIYWISVISNLIE